MTMHITSNSQKNSRKLYVRMYYSWPFRLMVFGVLIATLSIGGLILSRSKESRAAGLNIQYGIVTGSDTVGGTNGGASLGMHLARFYEKDRNSPASAWDSEVLNAVKKNIEPIILIDDDNMGRTTDSGSAPSAVASRFGPGGTFWQPGQPGYGYGQYAPRWLEWGNETSYGYSPKPGLESGDEYGISAKAAAQAMRSANPQMGLIIQGDSGGAGGTRWFDLMFGAVPDINSWVAGWSVHPYGPGTSKMDDMVSELSRKGAGNALIFITEDGPSTDNGAYLSPDNYGWSRNLTYSGAGTAIQDKLNLIKSKSYASRIRTYMQFQAFDQKPSGTGQREHYFGVYKNDGTEKTGYTSIVKNLASQNPRDNLSTSPTPVTTAPTPTSYNFTISGQTMLWNSVPGASQYKVYLADTKTYINLPSNTKSYTVPAPASGAQRQVGWTWYDGQDHWVAEQIVYFGSNNSSGSTNTNPTPTPTNNPNVPEVIVTRPSDPLPLISVPNSGDSSSVPIPQGTPKDKNGQIIGDFNGDGLNDIVFDLNKDGSINPKNEIIVDGKTEPNLTNKNLPTINVSQYRNNSLASTPLSKKSSNNDTINIKAGPLPEAQIPKKIAYSFVLYQGMVIAGLGSYFANKRWGLIAIFRARIGV